MTHFAQTFAAWWVDLPMQSAALFCLAFFGFSLLVMSLIWAWIDGWEKRAIKRRRKLAQQPTVCSPQVSRAYLRAFGERHEG